MASWRARSQGGEGGFGFKLETLIAVGLVHTNELRTAVRAVE